MKKMFVFIVAGLFLALPMVASAAIVGDCYDCHTMHDSEQNAQVGTAGTQAGLLKFDCLGCHAQAPGGAARDGSTQQRVAAPDRAPIRDN